MRTLAAVGLVAGHVAAAMAFAIFFARVPRLYQALFVQNAIAPTAALRGLLAFSGVVASYWYLLVLGTMAVDGVCLLLASVAPARWSWLGRTWSTLYLLGLLMAIGAASLILSITWNRGLLGTS